MKTIETIIDEIYSELDVEEIDKKPGSDLYSLVRSVAKSQYDSLQEINALRRKLSIEDSSKEELDTWGAIVGLRRKVGSRSAGYALAISESNVTILKDTFLTDLNTGNQFRVTERTKLSKFVEKRVPIEALVRSPVYNLGAGTILFSGNNPFVDVPANESFEDVEFRVGEYRTTSGEICGDLKGGNFPESDSSYRSRIKSVLRSSKVNSTESLKSLLLSEPELIWVDVNSPLPGMLLVYLEGVSSLSSERIEYYEDLLDRYVSAGVIYQVIEVDPTLINISVTISTSNDTDIQELSKRVRGMIFSYFYSRKVGDSIDFSSLASRLNDDKNVISSNVVSDPKLPSSEVIRPNNITISYEFN